MLVTSVLDELSVPMCTAVWGEPAGGMLEHLYQAHMFVSVVDQEERTYRYHQLIAEVLQAEQHARYPGRDKLLHAMAARYLAESGELGTAARHLLAAGDPAGAFHLFCSITGELDEALDLRDRAREIGATGIDDWIAGTDVLAMSCYAFMGELTKARHFAELVSAAGLGAPTTDVLCPALLSQVALIEGGLTEADDLAARALSSARRLRLDRH